MTGSLDASRGQPRILSLHHHGLTIAPANSPDLILKEPGDA
jgi:hypothetical protein